MSDYRKDFLGQTIIDNIKEYDPRLVARAPEGPALPADAPGVICSVCGRANTKSQETRKPA
jgi:hypothetical protein